jgi:nitroreductase
MDLLEAINERHSRRTYDGKSLPLEVAVKLHDIAAEYSKIPGVDIRFINNNGTAFNGLTKSYGIFRGVNDYFLLVRRKDNIKSNIKLGYYGEMLVLRSTQLGFNTCWVGVTFDKKDCPIRLEEDEIVECAITVGKSPKYRSFQENLIHFVYHPRTKNVSEMFTSEADVTPDWFLRGMSAVQRAPSALNRQPAHFYYHRDGTVSADVKEIEEQPHNGLDLGIAKLHFEIGSGRKFGGETRTETRRQRSE